MEGEDLGYRDLAAFARGLHPTSGRAMEASAFGARQGVVRNLLDEDVPEREAIAVRGPDEVAVGQVLAKLTGLFGEARFDRCDAGRAERPAEHTAELQDAPLHRRHQIQAGPAPAPGGGPQPPPRSLLAGRTGGPARV